MCCVGSGFERGLFLSVSCCATAQALFVPPSDKKHKLAGKEEVAHQDGRGMESAADFLFIFATVPRAPYSS